MRIRVRKFCRASEEDPFIRPVMHPYDGLKFRLELELLVPEVCIGFVISNAIAYTEGLVFFFLLKIRKDWLVS